MLGKLIEKQETLPDCIMIVDEKLKPMLEQIQALDSEDLAEVRAFINYLSESSPASDQGDSKVSAKICDFMAGGMLKVS